MEKIDVVKKYSFDISISLCKQDLDFARKLVKALNPGLKIFFYEDKQEELIGKSGPEKFAKIFKEESRIVVILSRNEWSKSFYTEIERNAIIDRTAVKNEGYEFLMIIPMETNESPSWYPSTKIYADPLRFSIEDLARFIEFKLTDEGGTIMTISLESRYQHFLDKIEAKKKLIKLQFNKEAIEASKVELNFFKDYFNSKIDFLKQNYFDRINHCSFSEHQNQAYFGMGEFYLQCNIHIPDPLRQRFFSTQDFRMQFRLYKVIGQTSANSALINEEQRLFLYNPPQNGWANIISYKLKSQAELQLLFRNSSNTEYYDLSNSMASTFLVDFWFQNLLSESTKEIEKHI